MVITTGSLWLGPYSDHQEELHRSIKELHLSGMGYRRIASHLNAEGVKTARGKEFASAHVHSILKKRQSRDDRLSQPPRVRYTDFDLRFVERKLISEDTEEASRDSNQEINLIPR